jgi:chromate reductase
MNNIPADQPAWPFPIAESRQSDTAGQCRIRWLRSETAAPPRSAKGVCFVIEILGISGSLRAKSYNTMLLRAAMGLAPRDMVIRPASIDLPLYNEDIRELGYPPPVSLLRAQIADADAVLIATPEYNYSVPGVLKNAIDWVSRPPDQPFSGKPVAIMGASPGRFGTVRAQNHLRQSLVALNANVLAKPAVMVGGAEAVFDDTGQLTDVATRDHVVKLLQALAVLVGQQRL